MVLNELLKTLQAQFDSRLPFVVYRKAYGSSLKSFLQKDTSLNYVSDYNTENGFIMAPFDEVDHKAVLIPSNKSEYIEIEFATSEIDVTASNSELPELEEELRKAQRKAHRKLVKKGRKATRVGELQKVVLSRKETLQLADVSPIEVFKRLLANYRDAFVYLWYHPEIGLWLGATPETLLTVNGKQLETMALAGTQDYIDFAHVVWGEKEREEQQFVTDYIVENLRPNVDDLHIGQTETIQAGNLLHLQTEIKATLNKEEVNLEKIIHSLHPTPAICGLPREKAKQFILEREGYDRKFYTGFLGELNMKSFVSRNQNKRNVENSAYQSVKKATDLFVNLRCMEIEKDLVHLYIGGGITPESVSKYEYRETVSKAETMKKVL